MADRLRLGTRGSPLALRQAEKAQKAITAKYAQLETELIIIKTSGDRDQTTPLNQLPDTGFFTKELEAALADGRIDVAVHSLKDMAAQTSAPYRLAAVLPRGSAQDVLVLNPQYAGLDDLPAAPVILTGSERRRQLLQGMFPLCQVRSLRGNIHTRLRKLVTQHADALVMSRAALERLGVETHPVVPLPVSQMVPAPGQGTIALEVLRARHDLLKLLEPLESEVTRRTTDMERHLSYLLQGGCRQPLGAHAYPDGDGLIFLVAYFPDGQVQPLFERMEVAPDDDPIAAAAAMAQRFHKRAPT